MATVELLVLSCDRCEAEDDDVRTHELVIDGKQRVLEACPACWASASVEELMKAGRRLPKQK